MNEELLYKIIKIIPKPLRKIIKKFYSPKIYIPNKVGYGERVMSEQEEEFFISKLKSVESIEGDVVEFGVFKGGSLLAMAKNTNKKIYGLDTFEGLPKPNKEIDGERSYVIKMNNTNIFAVQNMLDKNNIKNVELMQGLFKDTILELKDKRFSFAYVDCDLYEGTKQALEFLMPRMNKGGIIAIDDFCSNYYLGVRKAVLEFFKEGGLERNGGQVYIKI